MSKLKCENLDAFLLYISCKEIKLNSYELKVLLCWLIDKNKYSATPNEISRRTRIDKRNISKSLKSLVEKQILTKVTRTSKIQKYLIDKRFLENAKTYYETVIEDQETVESLEFKHGRLSLKLQKSDDFEFEQKIQELEELTSYTQN